MSSRKIAVGRTKKVKYQEKNNSESSIPGSSTDSFFVKPKSKSSISPSENINSHNKLKVVTKKFVRNEATQADTADDNVESSKIRKPFDKKAWRFKRYSNKYKLQQWKEVRKNNMLRGYNKTVKINEPFNVNSYNYTDDITQEKQLSNTELDLSDDNSINSNAESKSTQINPNEAPSRKKLFNKRHQATEEKEHTKLENLKRKTEKEQAVKEYKRKKLEKFKKLSRKTKKGQPIMKDRIEVLLEEIQNSIQH